MNYEEEIDKYFNKEVKKRKHNYPKDRKKGVNKNSQKYKLLQKYSLNHIQQTWVEYGMYKTGEILECNPWVVYHLAREQKWKRKLPQHLVKAHNDGCWTITNRYYIEKENKNV